MNKKRFRLLAVILLTCFVSLPAQNKMIPKLYAFGFSASFNDSIVYFTDIQEIENAWITGKKGFLLSRNSYSDQLRSYFTEKNQPHRTCVISYALDRKKIEKKYVKMRGKYTKKGNFDVRYLKTDEFKFTAVAPLQEENVNEDNAAQPQDKKRKKGKRSKK